MSTHYEVIVVGAGIFGSCAAYHSQKLGKKTLLLEQFELGHKNGSSHGKSRIIRYAHTDSAYVPVVHDAYQQIKYLEDKREEKLWRKTGLLWVSPSAVIDEMSTMLKTHDAEHTVVKGSEIALRYPQFNFKDCDSGLIDPMGGVIYADKWLDTFQDEFKHLGGTIKDNVELQSFDDGEKVTVHTSKGDFTADKLIITVGAWIGKVLPQLPLKIQPESLRVLYWETKDPKDSHLTEMGSFPVFLATQQEGYGSIFGLPSIDFPNAIKFMSHYGQKIEHGAVHPDVHNESLTDTPQRYLREFMPLFNAETPAHTDKCKYTNSQDDHYVIDFVTGSKNVLVGGCGSGSGFKVAPCIGKVLAEMSQGKETSVGVSFFSLKRFA